MIRYSKFIFYLFLVYAFIVAPVLFVVALVKRDVASLSSYAIILSLIVVYFKFGRDEQSFKIYLRSAFFSSYPRLCPKKVSNDQIVSICHEFQIFDDDPYSNLISYDREIIVFNQGSELSLPIEKWPQEVLQLLDMRIRSRDPFGVKSSRHIIGPVYYVHDVHDID